MSIVTEIRGYADTAVNTSRQAFDAATTQARANVTDIAGKATHAVHDLRASAEKAVNIARTDKRIGPLIGTAESLTGAVVTAVNDRVVQPVVTLAGRGKPSRPRRSSATSRPATRKATPTETASRPADKPATRKTTRKTTITSSANS